MMNWVKWNAVSRRRWNCSPPVGGLLSLLSIHWKIALSSRPWRLPPAGGGASRHDPAALSGRAKPAFHLLTPRALRPQEAEASANPRARSARLRGIERLALEHAA